MTQKVIRLVLELTVEETDRACLEKLRALCDLAHPHHEFLVEGSVLEGLLVAPTTAVVESLMEFPLFGRQYAENGTQINITLHTVKYGR